MYDSQYQQEPQARVNVMPPVVGILKWKGEIRSGIGQNSGNEWKSQDFAIEWAEGQYQRCAVFSLSGVDKVNAFKTIQIGTPVEVKFSLEGREYQGRYYCQLRAFSVRSIGQPVQQPQYQQPMAAPQPQYAGYQQQPLQQQPYIGVPQQPQYGGYPQPAQPQRPIAPAPAPADDLPFPA